MPINSYPFNGEQPVRRCVLRGRYKGEPRPINAGERPGEPAEVPVLRVPPCQTDEERGEGDSVNSRLHRLIGGSNGR